MPKEAPPRSSSRWEGTQTYARGDPTGKRPRTAAQVREEALRRIKEDRGKRNSVAERRRSLPAVPRPVNKPSGSTNKSSPEESSLNDVNTDDPPTPIEEDPEVEILSPAAKNTGEEMPGSNKKKRHASSAKPDESASSDGVDSGLKAFLNAMKEDINRATSAAVDRIDKRIDENAREIGDLKKAIGRQEAELGAKIATQVRTEIAKMDMPSQLGSSRAPGPLNDRREKAYHHCRRTLKIWPISGEDMQDEVKNFLSNQLGFDQRKIDSIGTLEISRVPGKRATERNEVLVTFESFVERDQVKAGGVNLAGKNDVGMSIHVPGHLLEGLFALNAVGYSIKAKHNGVKRAVKFDDQLMDIYMDICINGQWKRITPAEAKQAMKKVPSSTTGAGSLSADDLASLVQGEAVAGLTAVILPADEEQ